MADSRLRVGILTSLKTFSKTDQEVANILEWFMLDKIGPDPVGLTPAQVNQWRLDQAHEEVLNYMRREANKNRLKVLRAAQVNLETQSTSETNL